MSNILLKGIAPALITPFDKDGNVLTDSIKKNIDMNYGQGAKGFYIKEIRFFRLVFVQNCKEQKKSNLQINDDELQCSEVLGEDTSELKSRLEKIITSFKKAYYSEATGTFCSSLEASDAYAYDIGLGDERTLKAIVDKYETLGEFDTGIFGTDILIRVLCENGYKDLARKLLTSEKENTFYNMKKHGATTLWENWNGEASHSHPMFGAVVQYIVKYFNEV